MGPEFSAVVVTRGDVDVSPIVDRLLMGPVAEVKVWDNSKRQNLKVFGRYVGVLLARYPVVYVQDDDCVVDVEALWEKYEPGVLTTNMPVDRRAQYPVGALMGWGAIFDWFLPMQAFARYLAHYPKDEFFLRECDRIVTGLTSLKLVDVPVTHLPYAEGADRLGSDPNHQKDLNEVRCRVAAIGGQPWPIS